MVTRRTLKQSGFTLIEIVFAVLILAGSLVVLLGMQSASVTKTMRDRNQQQAMLVARSIMSGLEATQESLQNESIDGSAMDALRKYKLFIPKDPELKELYEKIKVKLTSQQVKIPVPSRVPVDPLKLYRLDIKLSWGNSPDDGLNLVYFANEQQL